MIKKRLSKKNKKAIHYIVGMLSTYIIWSAATPVIKLTLHDVPPFTFLLYRFLIICVVLLPYLIHKLRITPIHKEDILKFVILGVTSQSSLALLFLGLEYTTALESTVISLLGPILSVVAGHYFYHEKVNKKVLFGLFLATLGTLYVAIDPILEINTSATPVGLRLYGNFLVILYSLMFLLYIIWSKITLGKNTREIKRTLKAIHMKPMKKHYEPFFISVCTFYVGLTTFIPLAILENQGLFGEYNFSAANLTLVPVLGILYMALLSSILAYSLFEWSMEGVDVKDTAIISYLQPILTLPFAYLLLKELPNQDMIIGGSIIAIGVAIAESKKS